MGSNWQDSPYRILHLDGWDFGLEEAEGGGRTLDGAASLYDAEEALSGWRFRLGMDGHQGVLVVVDALGDRQGEPVPILRRLEFLALN